MKLKFIPILGLATVASTLPLTVSCGKYEGTVDLSKITTKGYERKSKYHSGAIEEGKETKIYKDAVKEDHNVFIDDIFETIADSTYWDAGSKLEGKLSLRVDDIGEAILKEKTMYTISASSNLKNVVLKLHEPKSEYNITEMSFNGQITVENLPFGVFTYNSKYELGVYSSLGKINFWKISIKGHASITTSSKKYEDNLNLTFDYINYKTLPILEQFALDVLLSYVRYDLPYFNKAGK